MATATFNGDSDIAPTITFDQGMISLGVFVEGQANSGEAASASFSQNAISPDLGELAEGIVHGAHSEGCRFACKQGAAVSKAGEFGGRPLGSTNGITSDVVCSFVLARSDATKDMLKPAGLQMLLRMLKWPERVHISKEVVASACDRLKYRDVGAGAAEEGTAVTADGVLVQARRRERRNSRSQKERGTEVVEGDGYGATFLPAYATAVEASGGSVKYWTVDEGTSKSTLDSCYSVH